VKISAYPTGMPCWLDLATPDLDTSTAFYTELFGWTARPAAAPGGGYTIFHRGEDPVAGAGPLTSEDQQTAWSWYASTDDAQAVVARVEEAGGKVLTAPTDVGTTARLAVFLDPSGAPFSVWQGRELTGARVVGEPGALGWTELMTWEPRAEVDFYGKVLGWNRKPGGEPEDSYTEFQIDGRSIAGMMPMTEDRYPPELPDHWMVYVCVEDTDATAQRVRELGGEVSVPPRDTPAGRYAIAVDPAGAWFALICRLKSPAPAG
jgi:predicted enzyme related to lactoylglutathione lyase